MKDNFLEEHYLDIQELLDYLKIGVWIADCQGKTIMANAECFKTGGLQRENVINKTVHQLVESGYFDESVTLKVLQSGKVEGSIQELGDGVKVYSIGQPMLRNGSIQYVITTERNITELSILQDILKDTAEANEKYKREIEYLKGTSLNDNGNLVAEDPATNALVEKAFRVAGHDTTVLILGESGTGKEVFADLIYKNSNRAGMPFIKVNCAAIPENLLESEMFGYAPGAFSGAEKVGKIGYFELANKGTIFLDEIGELSLHLQSKLLRVLQEKEIMKVGSGKPISLDVRIIAATNVSMAAAVENGLFREDLYYRLNVMPLEIPPLRMRKRDIGALAKFFIAQLGKQYKIKKTLSVGALEELERYPWPGNIRELKNIIERALISFEGSEINRFQIEMMLYPHNDTLATHAKASLSFDEIVEQYEKNVISEYLSMHKTASQTAETLHMSKATLSRKMKKYKLSSHR